MGAKHFLVFSAKVAAAHTLTYFVVGALAYQLLTKDFYVGPDPIFRTFMRTEAEPDLWAHVMRWFLPAQLLRGVLIAAVLWPFFETMLGWPFQKRWTVFSALYVVLGFWAAAVAAPGTIEGMVYLRPPLTGFAHLTVQPEILVQGVALGAIVSCWMGPQRERAAASPARPEG
jgi:hypothetical protein